MLYRNHTNTSTPHQEMESSAPIVTDHPEEPDETNPTPTLTPVLRCSIQGTHTRYQMKKVTRTNELDKYKSRVATRTWDPSLYDIATQLQMLGELWAQVSGESLQTERVLEKRVDAHLLMKKELETKLSGYRFQDQHKKREGCNITLGETIQKLLDSRLVCYYCNRQCHVFYERVREMSQWSLDRLDNDLCHSVQNVVVACLQCNLHRKNTNSKKFKDTKSMTNVRLLGCSDPSPTDTAADPLHSTEISDPPSVTGPCPFPTRPTTRTRFVSKKQKITPETH